MRAAMVYHYAAAGTIDHTEEYFPDRQRLGAGPRAQWPTAPAGRHVARGGV